MTKYINLTESHIDIVQLLKNAFDHVAFAIKNSSTKLEANKLPVSEFKCLDEFIVIKMRDEISDKSKELLDNAIKPSMYTTTLLATNEIVQLHRCGNCHEMAMVGFKFLLDNAPPDLQVEIFEVGGGDHVFLVINRDPLSVVSRSKEWGEFCYVGNFWSDNNPFFGVSELTNNLKIYKRSNGVNTLIDFEPDNHLLRPMKNMNIDYIRHDLEQYQIKCHFKKDADQVQTKLKEMIAAYMTTLNTLKSCEVVNNDRAKIYEAKIKKIEKDILNNEKIMNKVFNLQPETDLQKLTRECDEGLKIIKKSIGSAGLNAFEQRFFSQPCHVTLKEFQVNQCSPKQK